MGHRLCEFRDRAGLAVPLHIGGTDALVLGPIAAPDVWLRTGISLYGDHPGVEGLEPVMTFKSRVVYRRAVPAGTTVSYGMSCTTDRPTEIAVIGAGYGNGYLRALSGRGEVLLGGVRRPILGRVCKDQFMVDVTDGPAVAVGDEAVLFGRQGGVILPAAEVALPGRHDLLRAILPGRPPERTPRNLSPGGRRRNLPRQDQHPVDCHGSNPLPLKSPKTRSTPKPARRSRRPIARACTAAARSPPPRGRPATANASGCAWFAARVPAELLDGLVRPARIADQRLVANRFDEGAAIGQVHHERPPGLSTRAISPGPAGRRPSRPRIAETVEQIQHDVDRGVRDRQPAHVAADGAAERRARTGAR